MKNISKDKHEKLLNEIHTKIVKRKRISEILRGFDSPHVETTIGLIKINGVSVNIDRDTEWLHNELRNIEANLKQYARMILECELSEIDEWLANYTKSFD